VSANKGVATILISACLVGVSCTWRGGPARGIADGSLDSLPAAVKAAGFSLVPVCPEQLGGLPTPRAPAELQGSAADVLADRARVVNRQGEDVTPCFCRGARAVVQIARVVGATGAIMQDRSPSCGTRSVYDGSFADRLIAGEGTTVAALRAAGLPVVAAEEAADLLRRLTQPSRT
jgi:uncharacterized protein YbbK (DUF523 family)